MAWWRSSKCNCYDCVEVEFIRLGSQSEPTVLVRDSKNPDVVLRFTKAEWEVFVAGAKDGEFDV